MSWTKRQLVLEAFAELGLAADVYDLTPEQLQRALWRMDAMAGGWSANGVRVGYPLPSSPQNSDLDQDSGLPDFAFEAFYLGLAVRLASAYGKTVSPETKMFADMAYGNMANQVAIPTPERQFPHTLPRGAGTKPWRNFNNPFINKPEETLDAGSDGYIDLE